ncbi:hypothetical protein [Streptomyces cylindrosporus]|uniref:Uncharacterized protein n=1 Tax=Streptomyces cylindrosporus TaxID=2927583 RepID=A0ABS9XX45_9ACTN|nr:hypothetical protein [Streptomyces cylindrosporus]MCI3269533.1 hypothetical protein [Streptomyces cylindrosporus]
MSHDQDKPRGKDRKLGDGLAELLGDPEETGWRRAREEDRGAGDGEGEAGDAISPNEGAQEDARDE